MNFFHTKGHQPRGMSVFGIIFLILIIIFFLFFADMGYIIAAECDGDGFFECAMSVVLGGIGVEEEAPASSVTATGVLSGEFEGENHTVTIRMIIPLDGGAVTGNFSGDCDGTLKGTYAGGNGGAISGTGSGSCGYVIPASGSFSGTVNTTSKTVIVNGKGSAAGFNKEGTLTLTYQ